MSGRWMTAGDRCAMYLERPRDTGDGTVGWFRTRAVLRELCRVAHDAGVAQIGVDRLAARIGSGERSVRHALSRLRDDGTVVQAVRGTGNKHGAPARESVFVLRLLPDVNGELWPDEDWLRDAWRAYINTPRWDRLSLSSRVAVMGAAPVILPVDIALLAASSPPTSGNPLPPKSQDIRTNKAGGAPAAKRHPHAAARARRRLSVIQGAQQ